MNDASAFWKKQGQAAAELCNQLKQAATRQQDAVRHALAELCPEAAKNLDWHDSAALLGSVASCFQDDARWRRLSASLSGPTQPLDPTELGVGWQWLLGGFNQATRRHHGAYFTPPTLAKWMVAAVQAILHQHPPEAEADASKLAVVDPAAGTGIFLQHWREQADSSDALLGWELLPATAVVGDQLLHRYRSSAADATHCDRTIRHGNALDIRDISPWLSDPSTLVVIGNPPYSNFRSVNAEQPGAGSCSAWMLELLSDYKQGLTERKHNLHDDLIQFMRWGQHHLETAGRGVLAFVTNNTYLTGLTHHRMRQSLLRTFDVAYFLNLHGEQFQRDAAHPDENIFGIRQGVAVSIWFRHAATEHNDDACACFYADLLGTRADKLKALELASHTPLASSFWEEFQPTPPSSRLRSVAGRDLSQLDADLHAYQSWPSLPDLIRQYVSGVQTKADRIFIHRDRATLERQIQSAIRTAQRAGCDAEGGLRVDGCDDLVVPNWLQPRLGQTHFDPAKIVICQVAPMDHRWLYYDPQLLGRARYSVMRHVIRGERGFVFMRQSKNPGDYDHFLTTRCPVTDRVFHSRHGAPFIAPWWLYDDDAATPDPRHHRNSSTPAASNGAGRHINLTPLAWQLTGRPSHDCEAEPLLEIWHYIYAVTHATEYRHRFAPVLSLDFPRIPPAESEAQFAALAEHGQALALLHCSTPDTAPPKDAAPVQQGPWRVGGLDVLHRWQHQRRHSPLDLSEQTHLAHLQHQAAETQRLVSLVDQVFGARIGAAR